MCLPSGPTMRLDLKHYPLDPNRKGMREYKKSGQYSYYVASRSFSGNWAEMDIKSKVTFNSMGCYRMIHTYHVTSSLSLPWKSWSSSWWILSWCSTCWASRTRVQDKPDAVVSCPGNGIGTLRRESTISVIPHAVLQEKINFTMQLCVFEHRGHNGPCHGRMRTCKICAFYLYFWFVHFLIWLVNEPNGSEPV